MSLQSLLPDLPLRTNWKGRKWRLWRLAVAMVTFLSSLIYMSFNLSSPTTNRDILANKRIPFCTDFNIDTIFKSLDSSVHLDDHMYTNDEVSDFVCGVVHHNMNLTAKLNCSTTIDSRYHDLRPVSSNVRQIRYYFALDLH